MKIKLNIEREDLLLWAKYEQYKPSDPENMSNEEKALEFVISEIEEQIYLCRLKEAKHLITAERPVITTAYAD